MSHEGKDINQIYEALTQKDVQDAADTFRNLYNETDGQDGYVSLEVNPHLAHDTQGTIEEARRLWKALNRPNVFIKVPATKEGLPAIKQLISEGINVNVTLLFGLTRYRDVAEAYIAGIEARLAQGKPVTHVASVASFFLSRIDVLIDPLLETYATEHAEMSDDAQQLQGQIAIASATMAYQIFNELFKSDRFKKLAEKGAHVQRLLWASTSTKNPNYSDVKYIEALIAPLTVNTLPLETIDAYRDHGDPAVRIGLDNTKTMWYFEVLSELGINIDQMTQQLEDEGVAKFIQSYDKLMETLKKSCEKSQ
jgi:transaldolase